MATFPIFLDIFKNIQTLRLIFFQGQMATFYKMSALNAIQWRCQFANVCFQKRSSIAVQGQGDLVHAQAAGPRGKLSNLFTWVRP